MRNQELKEKFLLECSDRVINIIEQASELENSFGKDIFELDYNEAEKMVEQIQDDKITVIKVLQAYTRFAIVNAYSTNNVNVFDLI